MPIRRKKPKPSEEAYQHISTVVRQATVAQQAGTTNPRGLTKEQRAALKRTMIRQQTYIPITTAAGYISTSGGVASVPSGASVPPSVPRHGLSPEYQDDLSLYIKQQVREHLDRELKTALAAFQEQIDEIWEEIRE